MNDSPPRPARAATIAACALVLLLACPAGAATLLEYTREGPCPTEFERMALDGLQARIDIDVDGSSMSTLFDDDEQLMHQLMHDTRDYMTLESDDDAVDFTSDVGRSVLLHADKQTQALTGSSSAQLIEAHRQAQVAACPEMAAIGMTDPDYADAALRCARKMASTPPVAGNRASAIGEALRQRGGRPFADAGRTAAARADASVKWSTTKTERAATTETIDGRACIRERILRGDTVLREDCYATIESLALEPRAARRLARIAKVGAGLGAGISSLQPDAAQERARPPSVSLERVCYRDGTASGRARLHIRTAVAIDASTFRLPPDYTPIEIAAPPATVSPERLLEQLQQGG
jgi:hypothetical protein